MKHVHLPLVVGGKRLKSDSLEAQRFPVFAIIGSAFSLLHIEGLQSLSCLWFYFNGSGTSLETRLL